MCFMLWSFSQNLAAANIDVTVEPQTPTANESFRIIFRADGAVDAEPDFEALEARVEIIGRNRQTAIQWVNGRNSRTTTWVLDVIADTPGELVIPAIAFGSVSSTPLRLEIAAGEDSGRSDEDALVLEIDADNLTPYVQQEVILTVRFLRRVELNDANLTEPQASTDAIIKRLGNDTTYQTKRNGKRYEAFERRYSVFPQTSGTTEIAPLILTTQVVQSARSVFDPFRQSMKTHRVKSNGLTLQVKPIPATYTGATWLPARRLSLRDDWSPDADTIEPGEPLERTVFLWAEGLNAGQLPEVEIALPEGLKVYPDQPQSSEQQTDSGFSALRQQKYALIPHAQGQLSFPQSELTWWNTATDRMEVARLDAREFVVSGTAPASGVAPAPVAIAEPDDTPLSSTVSTPQSANIDLEDRRYATAHVVAALGLIGWFLTGYLWWRSARRGTRDNRTNEHNLAHTESLSRARRDVLGACKARNPAAAKAAVIRWANIGFDGGRFTTLGEIASHTSDPLRKELEHLSQLLYGNGDSSWDGDGLSRAVGDYRFAQIEREKQKNVNSLPPLFRLAR